MITLTRMIETLAAWLMKMGIPAGQTTLYAWILIYLLVTGFLAALLLGVLLRRRPRAAKRFLSPSDLES